MRQLLLAWLVVLLGAGLLFTSGACATGGGPAVSLTLSGPYCWAFWSGDVTGPQARAEWGTADGDGMGNLVTAALVANDNGAVGPLPGASLPYTIGTGSELTLTAGVTVWSGGIATDGSVAVLGTTAGFDPGILVLGKKGAGFGLASLSGLYHICAFFFNAQGSENTWFNGTAEFDAGSGTVTSLDVDVNSNGTITMPMPAAAGTYTVDPDGHVVWSFPGTGPFVGGLFAGGEVAVLTGSAMNGVNLQYLIVLIPKGTGLGDADFSGTYFAVSIGADNVPPPRYLSFSGTSTADGAGTWTIALGGVLNEDGAISNPMGTPAAGYSVAADGALDVLGGVLLGGISQTGRFAVFAGANTNNANPVLWLLVRSP